MDSTTAPSTAMRTATTAPETIDFMAFRSPAIACDGLFLSRRAAFGRRDRFQVGDEILAILRRRHALQRHLAARRVGVGAKREEPVDGLLGPYQIAVAQRLGVVVVVEGPGAPAEHAVQRRPRPVAAIGGDAVAGARSEEHTSELQSLMRISYA